MYGTSSKMRTPLVFVQKSFRSCCCDKTTITMRLPSNIQKLPIMAKRTNRTNHNTKFFLSLLSVLLISAGLATAATAGYCTGTSSYAQEGCSALSLICDGNCGVSNFLNGCYAQGVCDSYCNPLSCSELDIDNSEENCNYYGCTWTRASMNNGPTDTPSFCSKTKQVAVRCLTQELDESQASNCIDCLDSVPDSFTLTPSDFDSCDAASAYYCASYHNACDNVCSTCKEEIEADFLCIAESMFPECGDMSCNSEVSSDDDNGFSNIKVMDSNFKIQLVRNINGEYGSYPNSFVGYEPCYTELDGYGANFRGKMFFTAYTSQTGREPWFTDGSEEGTYLLKDINTGSSHSNVYGNAVSFLGDKVIFAANDGLHGMELWITDGTSDGTRLLKDINVGETGSDPSFLYNLGGVVYFFVREEDDPAGFQLYKTKGSPENTVQVTNKNGGFHNITRFRSINGLLIFGSNDELWASDGTNAGTKQLNENLVLDSPRFGGTWSTLIFGANDGTGSALWKTDGTSKGTVKVFDGITVSQISGARDEDTFVLIATENDELWASDGSTEGTKFLSDALTSIVFGSLLNGKRHFVAKTQSTGMEMYTSDGTPEGTSLFYDFAPGAASIKPRSTAHISSCYGDYLFAMSTGNKYQVWTINGDGTAPTLVLEFVSSTEIAFFLEELDDFEIMLRAYEPSIGVELFKLTKTNGSGSPTSLMYSIHPIIYMITAFVLWVV